jgi:hypothetical protein
MNMRSEHAQHGERGDGTNRFLLAAETESRPSAAAVCTGGGGGGTDAAVAVAAVWRRDRETTRSEPN